MQDEGEPSTPRVHVIPVSPDRCTMPPHQLQIPSASNPTNIYFRKSKSLQVNIQDPLRKELVRCATEAFLTPLPSSSRASPIQKNRPASVSAPTQDDVPQKELLHPRERRTKMKQDKRPRKKP